MEVPLKFQSTYAREKRFGPDGCVDSFNWALNSTNFSKCTFKDGTSVLIKLLQKIKKRFPTG